MSQRVATAMVEPLRLFKDFEKRHDIVSSARQQKIANVVIVVNILLYVLFQIARSIWSWDFQLGTVGAPIFYLAWLISMCFLVLASDVPYLFIGISQWLRANPPLVRAPSREPLEITRARKYPYYLGVLLNLGAIGILVEQSGGLVTSPFSPVLFAMILAAQQLGRYRSNSWFFILFGLGTIAMLAIYERFAGLRTVASAPDELVFWILLAGFTAAAVFTHVDKVPNFRAMGGHPHPSHAALSLDSDGQAWRITLFAERYQVECCLPYCARGSDEPGAKQAFQEYVKKDIGPALGCALTVRWSDDELTTGRLVAALERSPESSQG